VESLESDGDSEVQSAGGRWHKAPVPTHSPAACDNLEAERDPEACAAGLFHKIGQGALNFAKKGAALPRLLGVGGSSGKKKQQKAEPFKAFEDDEDHRPDEEGEKASESEEEPMKGTGRDRDDLAREDASKSEEQAEEESEQTTVTTLGPSRQKAVDEDQGGDPHSSGESGKKSNKEGSRSSQRNAPVQQPSERHSKSGSGSRSSRCSQDLRSPEYTIQEEVVPRDPQRSQDKSSSGVRSSRSSSEKNSRVEATAPSRVEEASGTESDTETEVESDGGAWHKASDRPELVPRVPAGYDSEGQSEGEDLRKIPNRDNASESEVMSEGGKWHKVSQMPELFGKGAPAPEEITDEESEVMSARGDWNKADRPRASRPSLKREEDEEVEPRNQGIKVIKLDIKNIEEIKAIIWDFPANGGCHIRRLKDECPDGLTVGDVLVSINGTSAYMKTKEQIEAQWREAQRGSRFFEIELTERHASEMLD
jgi:hypothetical protein